jgi:hypothetical protein
MPTCAALDVLAICLASIGQRFATKFLAGMAYLTGAGLWLVAEFEFRVHWNPRCATERGSPNLAARSLGHQRPDLPRSAKVGLGGSQVHFDII